MMKRVRAVVWMCLFTLFMGSIGVAVASEILFSDDFEGTLQQFTVNGVCSINSAAARSGASGVRCDDSASLTASLSTAGADSIQLSYSRRTERYDLGEEFIVEFSNNGGASWQEVERIPNTTSFGDMNFSLGADAEDTALLIRFRATASGLYERFDLDNVLVTGDTGGSIIDDNCDGIDDDNDGQIDEDFVQTSTSCGIGACAATGIRACIDAQITNTCTPGIPALSDPCCDGIDNDCDGSVDEDGGNTSDALFEEDFEGDLSQFSVSGVCTISTAAARTGANGVRCDDQSSLTAGFSTEGFENIQLTYSRRTQSYDANEYFYAEVSNDGVNWTELERVNNETTFSDQIFQLDSAFAQQPDVQIRFRSNAYGFYEQFDLDDISVVGDPASPADDCDGIDNDGDGLIDEDFTPQPTQCGLGICSAAGELQCVNGTLVDTCTPGTPISTDDADCNGIDDNCNGLIDEDCGPAVHIRMDAAAADFFSMPWPSDHRRFADGTLDIDGFPGIAEAEYEAGLAAMDATLPYLDGFGTGSAVFFTLTGDVDSSALPDPVAATADDSPVMLVNLDDPSAPRLPLLLDFKSTGANLRPDRLLTVLPQPGFALDPETTYAVIVFNTLPITDGSIARSPLLDNLASGSQTNTGLSAAEFALLQNHKSRVDAYVAAHTGYAPENVVSFAVYTTQSIGQELFGVAKTIADMSDTDILNRIGNLTASNCPSQCSIGKCYSSITGTIQIPRFQTPLTYDINMLCIAFGRQNCVTTSGGEIELDSQGNADVQFWEQDVNIRILVPCSATPPQTGWPILFHASGTGGSENSITGRTNFLNAAGRPINFVGAAITPYCSWPRYDQGIASQLFAEEDAEGGMWHFWYNPLYASTNPIQSAADALFVKRVLGVLDQAAAQSGIHPAALGLPTNGLDTNPDQAILTGQSQGATSAPIALAVSPAQGGFRHAFLNATGSSHLFYKISLRPSLLETMEGIFPLAQGELDMYHPVGHLLQTLTEIGRCGNYARYVSTDNFLITAGYQDACTLRESANAIATELYRVGSIEAADTSAAFSQAGMPVPQIDGIQTVLGVNPHSMPVSGNLPNSGTGVYMLLEGHHGASNADPDIGRFLSDIAQGATPTITGPPYNPGSYFICEERLTP